MKWKPPICLAGLFILLTCTASWADQIVLKDGTVYSGKFIRGDSNLIDFRVLGRVESFKTTDISKLVFGEPELAKETGTPVSKAKPQASLPEKDRLSPVKESPRPQSTRSEVVRQDVQASTITVQKGMTLVVRTMTEIDTDRNRVGDSFEAILDESLVSGTQTVASRGSLAKGRIAYAQESGKLTGQAQLVLELTDLVINGKTYALRTSDYTELGSSRGNRTAATVGWDRCGWSHHWSDCGRRQGCRYRRCIGGCGRHRRSGDYQGSRSCAFPPRLFWNSAWNRR